MSHSEQDGNADGSDIRIAVVDDHEMFRAGVIATLQTDFDIVGQAGDVEGAIEMIAQTKPDVVLLDVHVPGGAGGGGTEILTRSHSLRSLALRLPVAPLIAPAFRRRWGTQTLIALERISG